MLDRLWIVTLAALGVWAAIGSHQLLALCTTAGLLLSGWAAIARRFGLSGVTYQRRLSTHQAQFGEHVVMEIELRNLKLLPIAALRVEDQLPRFLPLEGGIVRSGHLDAPQLCITRAMLPYERVVRRFDVRCTRRGVHRFGPARYEAFDYTGTRSRHRTTPDQQPLLVLPKLMPLALGREVRSQLVGKLRAPHLLLSDPLRTLGARGYVAGDPMRLVDWRASARRGDLMVRVLEPSATPALEIALDFCVTRPIGDRIEPDELEFAISIAASLAAYTSQRKWRLGLRANALADGTALAVPPSSAPDQLRTVLELLARAGSVPHGTLADMLLRRSARTWQESGSLVVITSQLEPPLLAALHALRRSRDVLVVVTSDDAGASASIPILRCAYAENWLQRESVVLRA